MHFLDAHENVEPKRERLLLEMESDSLGLSMVSDVFNAALVIISVKQSLSSPFKDGVLVR